MRLPKKRWLFLGVAVVAIAAFATYFVLHEELIEVQVDKVLKKELVEKVSAPGKIQPVEEVEISAYVSAEITNLFVKEGDVVEKGDLLVELDSTRYKATLDQARAAMYGAQSQEKLALAQLEQSERMLKRTKELYKKSLVGKQQLEEVETAQKVNKATVQAARDSIRQAKAVLRLARDEVSKTTIASPIAGKISRLPKEVGEIVMGSTFTRDVIMKVADLSAMEAIVEVDENDVVDINLDDLTEVEVDALPKRIFMGKVTKISISPIVKALGSMEETTNFEVTVLLEGDVSPLRPGMNATANIITEKRDEALSLPIQCVTMRDVEKEKAMAEGADMSELRGRSKDDLSEVVFLFNDGDLKLTEVKTGISSDTEIELIEGVKEKDLVVCGPYKILHKDLKDGQKVEIPENDENEGKPES